MFSPPTDRFRRGAQLSALTEFPLEGGGRLLVEVAPSAYEGPVVRGRSGGTEVVTRAEETFERVIGQLGPMLRGLLAEIRQSVTTASEVEVEFAVKLSADANVVIARTGGEAHFRIQVTWTPAGGSPEGPA